MHTVGNVLIIALHINYLITYQVPGYRLMSSRFTGECLFGGSIETSSEMKFLGVLPPRCYVLGSLLGDLVIVDAHFSR